METDLPEKDKNVTKTNFINDPSADLTTKGYMKQLYLEYKLESLVKDLEAKDKIKSKELSNKIPRRSAEENFRMERNA
jgi:hypothetical protein